MTRRAAEGAAQQEPRSSARAAGGRAQGSADRTREQVPVGRADMASGPRITSGQTDAPRQRGEATVTSLQRAPPAPVETIGHPQSEMSGRREDDQARSGSGGHSRHSRQGRAQTAPGRRGVQQGAPVTRQPTCPEG